MKKSNPNQDLEIRAYLLKKRFEEETAAWSLCPREFLLQDFLNMGYTKEEYYCFKPWMNSERIPLPEVMPRAIQVLLDDMKAKRIFRDQKLAQVVYNL